MKSSFESTAHSGICGAPWDQDGDVIDILVQPHRDQRAAGRFFRKLLRGQGSEPLQIITDQIEKLPVQR